jgi:hypothetical protein
MKHFRNFSVNFSNRQSIDKGDEFIAELLSSDDDGEDGEIPRVIQKIKRSKPIFSSRANDLSLIPIKRYEATLKEETGDLSER